MNSRSKKGFTLIEALIGLVIFSWMLSLYVPGYLHHLQHFQQLQLETVKWQNFFQLVQLTLNQKEAEPHLNNLEETIEILNLTQKIQIVAFTCDQYQCYISFSDGSDLLVEIQTAHH